MTEALLDFKKDGVPAKWGAGYPAQWGSNLEKHKISLKFPIKSASGSPDGILLAVTAEKHIYIYDTINFQVVEVLRGHHTVRYVEFRPCLGVGGDTYQLTSWSTSLERETPSFIFCWSLALNGTKTNSREIFTSSPVTDISLEQRKFAGLALHDGNAYSQDGKVLVISIGRPDEDTHVQLCVLAFDLISWSVRFRIDTNPGMVSCVFSPNSNYMAISSQDGYTKFHDGATGAVINHYGHVGIEKCHLAFSPDSKSIAVTAFTPESGGIIMCHASNKPGEPLTKLRAFGNPIRSLAWSPDGTLIALGSSSGELVVYNTKSLERLQVYQSQPDSITDPKVIDISSMQWLEGGEKLAFRSGATLMVYDFISNKKRAWSQTISGGLRGFVYLEGKRWIGTVSEDGDLLFWDLSDASSEGDDFLDIDDPINDEILEQHMDWW